MDEILLEQVTQAYYDLLKSIKWDDKVFMAGIREGLNKFLSNAIIRTKGGGGKYFQGDYYTEAAIKKLKNNDTTTEINYEHIIPKKKHIQEPCEKMAKENRLEIAEIKRLVKQFYKIAIVTKDEHKKLPPMPPDWDGEDIFYRYKKAGIELHPREYVIKKIKL